MANPIALTRLRTLALDKASRPGRPAHVSAASGLVRVGDRLYVVADDENHLGIFPVAGNELGTLARLSEGKLPLDPEKRKRRKRDFESLARLPAFEGYPDGALLALGSCSRPGRCEAILAGLDKHGRLDGTLAPVDFAPLREALEERFGRLNIEGALTLGDELILLQRGNKGDRRNARIRFQLAHALESLAAAERFDVGSLLGIDPLELGAVDDVPLGISDGAALPDGRMVFTAIAEDTADSYEDGACRGAALGIVGKGGSVDLLDPIDPGYKVEGIEARIEGDSIRVLMVTDADNADIPASLVEARLPS
jgi:hypothetical protein